MWQFLGPEILFSLTQDWHHCSWDACASHNVWGALMTSMPTENSVFITDQHPSNRIPFSFPKVFPNFHLPSWGRKELQDPPWLWKFKSLGLHDTCDSFSSLSMQLAIPLKAYDDETNHLSLQYLMRRSTPRKNTRGFLHYRALFDGNGYEVATCCSGSCTEYMDFLFVPYLMFLFIDLSCPLSSLHDSLSFMTLVSYPMILWELK